MSAHFPADRSAWDRRFLSIAPDGLVLGFLIPRRAKTTPGVAVPNGQRFQSDPSTSRAPRRRWKRGAR